MRKIKGGIIAAMFLVSLLAINSVSAQPQPTVVWVDDDFDALTPGWGVTHFDKIQDGVDNVAVGGTVHVAAGTYTEQLTINKTLTLQGSGQPTLDVSGFVG
ncbi:MAG TPA: hypothetical protein ENI52_04225, partial [Thermoplasmata archaeon]|nr:hypothetical protein [Thermoplasmata archaeon]